MKAVQWMDIDRVELNEVLEQSIKPEWVRIRTLMGGICGSDVTIISGKHPRAKAPLILGHEIVGIIESLGEGACLYQDGTPIHTGDRVTVEPILECGECSACRRGKDHVCEHLRLLGVESDGGFAESFTAPAKRLFKIPSSISDKSAAILEPLSVAVHAVHTGVDQYTSTAVILGAGPIGLLIGLVLKSEGINDFWISEVDDHRISLAQSLGFRVIDGKKDNPVERIRQETGNRGVDVTFDAAGVSAVGMQLIPLTAVLGTIVMVALHKDPCQVHFRQLSYGEQIIKGVRIYARGDFAHAIELLSKGTIEIEPLISHVFPVHAYRHAFDIAKDSSKSCKVLIDFR